MRAVGGPVAQRVVELLGEDRTDVVLFDPRDDVGEAPGEVARDRVLRVDEEQVDAGQHEGLARHALQERMRGRDRRVFVMAEQHLR